MTDYFLGLDCGGTFIKAGIYDITGTEYGIARHNLPITTPQPGWAERDMHTLWQTAAEVIRELLDRTALSASAISGVGISAQGKGLFLLDKHDKPLGHAILSSDQRAREQVLAWQQAGIPQALYPQTRQTLWTGHPVSLLRWLKDHQPTRYAQIGTLFMAHDYMRFCLTGERACEETNISESNLYNMDTGRYDPALAEQLGIAEIVSALPPIIGSTDIAGRITPEAAQLTGLRAGTPSSVGYSTWFLPPCAQAFRTRLDSMPSWGHGQSPAASPTPSPTATTIPSFMAAMRKQDATSCMKPAPRLRPIWNGSANNGD